ncbi:hypothetical protein [Streptomyces sp. NPDC047009]
MAESAPAGEMGRRLAHDAMLGAERFFAVRGYLSTAAKQGKNLLAVVTRT